MTTTTDTEDRFLGVPHLGKDIGVVIVVIVALLLGWLLREATLNRTIAYQDSETGFSLQFPAAWGVADSLQDVMLKVENPNTGSAYKTNLVVEARDLDPQNPPTLQEFVDRRVTQKGNLTGYHFIGEQDGAVDGNKAREIKYAYVVQPIDQPRRASLPVVVEAREYIIVGKDRVYYITVAAPQDEFDAAGAQLDQIVKSVDIP
ncbi:MAG TPA: hypothetical protein VMP08_13835 [Anaerolineae bacterium]|nr:hypothetical protein [Anaerolineae bacterium]